MRIVYKKSLAFIGFLIAICGLIGVSYLFYDKVIENETEVVVLENLSINYLNGYKISGNGTYNFSITNNSSENIYFDILINELKGYDENVKYNIFSNEIGINITNNIKKNNNTIGEGLFIGPESTQNYTLIISNNTKTSFKLKISINSSTEEYFYATLLKNNKVKKEATTKIGEEIATTNEGLIEEVDDYGLTYYYRGKIENNYVKFADLLWRIVRINGDGTVKLVLNTAASELINYHDNINDYEDIEKSTLAKKLADFYELNLKNYDSYIEDSKYCKEKSYTEGEILKTYNTNIRLVTNKIPTFSCLGEMYKSKISILTADEILYAGANFEKDNKEYYLYNEEIENIWWTSTLSKASTNIFYPFVVTANGKLEDDVNGTLYRNYRPTINLRKKIIVKGEGTIDEPYEIIS